MSTTVSQSSDTPIVVDSVGLIETGDDSIEQSSVELTRIDRNAIQVSRTIEKKNVCYFCFLRINISQF